jgi:hypothetical protein
MDRYRELSERPPGPDEPPKGSWEALRRHVGVISQEDGDELLRIIMEAREASKNDQFGRGHPMTTPRRCHIF